MRDLVLTPNTFNSDPYWTKPIPAGLIKYEVPDLFDQNGYDLCEVEKLYAFENRTSYEQHREHRAAIRNPWFTQPYKNAGAVLNHALLFERKGYSSDALSQLLEWAETYPAYYRLVNIKPKWGLDFSMDYYDREGNTFEVLHWEYDGFNYFEMMEKKEIVEELLISIDWDDAAKEILKRKDEWYYLDFFAQSDYKCKYFGVGSERWKMVVWE